MSHSTAATAARGARTLFVGPVIHSLSLHKMEILPRAALAVDNTTGRIAFFEKDVHPTSPEMASLAAECERIVRLTGNQFLVPGLVDTHTHAPQYVNSGIGYDEELLQWLDKYTFPAEAKFQDSDFARHVYDRCVRRHLINGTTTCAYFATIHLDASVELARSCKRHGQRALVGKVNMDQMAPDFYVESSAEESLRHTEQFVREVIALNERQGDDGATSTSDPEDLVIPVITPRFVPTCSPSLMRGLSDLAKQYRLPIQSHVSENIGEVRWIRELYPDSKSYTEVYDRFGLLTDRTILAHGVLLTDEEVALLRKRGTTVAHCPLSNFSLNSGVLNIRRLLDNGVRVSLGTDVSGGYSPSMLNAMRSALINSVANAAQFRVDNRDMDSSVKKYLAQTPEEFSNAAKDIPAPLTVEELLFMATLGGAQSLGLGSEIGNFEEGKQFDALLVDLDVEDSPVDTFLTGGDVEYRPHELYGAKDGAKDEAAGEHERLRLLFQRFVFLADDRNIAQIFVRGQEVHSRV